MSTVQEVYDNTVVTESSGVEERGWIRDEGIAHDLGNNEKKGFPEDEDQLLIRLMQEEVGRRLCGGYDSPGERELTRLHKEMLREKAQGCGYILVSRDKYFFAMGQLEDSVNPDCFSTKALENWINYEEDCVWQYPSDHDGLNSLYMIPDEQILDRLGWFQRKLCRAVLIDLEDDLINREDRYNPEEIMWKDLMRRLYEEYPDKIGCSFISGELILSISSGKFKTEIGKRGVILINEEKSSFSREYYSRMDSDEELQRFYGMTRRVLERAESIPFYKKEKVPFYKMANEDS
ncbi:hypothetical protein K8R20_00160 [bacterium]|nr:hypothetical protein [bacterium]